MVRFDELTQADQDKLFGLIEDEDSYDDSYSSCLIRFHPDFKHAGELRKLELPDYATPGLFYRAFQNL